MRIDRREFLGAALGGTAGMLLADRLAVAAPVNADITVPVPLGKNLKVSRMGFGTGMKGLNRQSNQTRLGALEFDRLLQYCYDRHIRLFDMADLYGSHPFVARAMKGKPRDSYALVTKLWFPPWGLPEPERPDADVCVARFLKELETDYIDVVQIHCQTSGKWPEEMRKQMDLLAELKRKGAIRAHGVSIHSLAALERAADEPWVDVIHTRVNPYARHTDGPMEKVVPILQKIHAAGKGIIGMKLVGEGTLNADQRSQTLRYVMDLGCVDAMIVGFEKVAHVDEFRAGVERNLAEKA
jgi:aryl-alcohol dehydrogenase-like predicted oxidoreductase